MKKLQIGIMLLVVLVAWLVASPAAAGVCDSEFGTLIGAINTATYKLDKDRSALEKKALAAQSKANNGKVADAINKLNEIIGKADLLTSNGKIIFGGPQISIAASNTISCLQ